MNIVILGPQGSGKGTFSSLIAQRFNLKHISTGDIFRKNKEFSKYTDKGQFVPDELVFKIITPYLKNNIILDGFPRNLKQAVFLDKKIKINYVFFIDLSFKIILQRLKTRIQCPECNTIYSLKTNPPKKQGICDICNSKLTKRTDDIDEKAVKTRLDNYNKEIKNLLDFYSKEGILFKIDGSQTIEKTTEEIYSKITKNI